MSTPARRTLVAGVGNIFLGDDGFGVETVRRLAGEPLPAHVETLDVGVRGVHLAYQLLDGYDTFVLLDATARGGEPGTLYLIEGARPGGVEPQEALLDGHRMSPDAVLALLDTLCVGTGGTPPRRTLMVGCEPACVEEGIGLSAPVADAVPEAVRLVLRLLGEADADADAEELLVTDERNAFPC
ncbi:hydrogenase maturation protease [Kitasatospora sp. MAP5-34]|uniref:hydrogenase maturation protease n=1 Tax=Kitasatospora sp. MAP5-34 TaxID=3035102 RepID=UPI002476BCAF|nr:hydrogenase maturation protease [Kitasatospora sp. MAP5-34]MDH6579270.1 hydrogenase maturation protease [Kitasatospora sp. MAP5-34]